MIAVLSWWLAIQVCGLVALPLAWRLLARLPGRGYPLAKALGLLLVSYILWLGASFHLLPNDLGGILAAFAVLAALSLWLGRPGLRRTDDGQIPLFAWLKANRLLVLATEVLFLAALAGWAFFRAHSGDIAATEKPMEFTFINGVLNSRFFPPQDPWLSGYAISYYYFGYVMLALLIRLTGVLPEAGFNLGVALWFALVLIGAFGVVYDLVRLAARHRAQVGEQQPPADSPGRAIRWGLLGALFVGIMGNLEVLVEAAYNARLVPLSWIQWLDIKDLTANAPTGDWAGTGWWWWHASRVIHDKDLLGASVEVIDEFPFFSFLLGDLHPHVLALPFVLLAISLSVNLLLAARDFDWQAALDRPVRGARADEALDGAGLSGEASPAALGVDAATSLEAAASPVARWLRARWQALGQALGLGTPAILMYGLVFGGLSFLNTWDFPIYLALATLAFGVGLASRRGLTLAVALETLAVGATLGILGWLAYLPFYLGFQSQAGGLLPNLLFPTRLSQFFVMFGLFLVVAVFFLALVTRELRQSYADTGRNAGVRSRALSLLPWTVLGPVVLLALVLALFVLLPAGRAVVNDLINNPAVRSRLPDVALGPLLGLIGGVRLATPWTYLALAGLLAWVGGVLWSALTPYGPTRTAGSENRAAGTSARADAHLADLFVVLMIGLALLLAFSVEFVYLKDYFGTRMNTVFKFYYQAWILLALAGAYGLSRLAERATSVALAAPALLLAILLGAGGIVYPLLATPSKAGDFQGPGTLDGLAYMQQYDPGDAAAIGWLRQNVSPTAVVLEAPGGSYSTEGAERISMSTGNPTLLGWDFHERQWRGDAFDKLTAGRTDAIDRIYRSGRPEELRDLMNIWSIDYVYVGALERRKYGITDQSLARFDRAGLRLVYDAQGVRIYAR